MLAATITAAVGVQIAAERASAAGTINVNTTGDENGSGAGCSLREAFKTADDNANFGGCTGAGGGAPFTVNVPAGTYALTAGELVVGDATNTSTAVVGVGSASTIIRQDTLNARVVNVNPTLAANVAVSFTALTISGGSTIDPFGGGGLIAGGPGNTLSLSNCIVSDNESIAPMSTKGGGIEFAGGGQLTVNNCTFDNNRAQGPLNDLGIGGAIDYELLNNPGQAGIGGISITNSTFNNNRAYAQNSGAGGAIALAVTTTQADTGLTVTNNTFTNNQALAGAASGHGGAITDVSASPHTVNVKFNRFSGNTATGQGSGIYKSLGSTGSIDATRNWWGCNAGPNTAGCASTGGVTANITTAPRLRFTHTPAATTIGPGAATTLTVDFTTDSANAAVPVAQLTRIIGVPVTFNNPVKGSLSAAQATIQANGKATATFTGAVLANCGAGSADAVFDSQTITTGITIACAPDTFIDTHPSNPSSSPAAAFTFHSDQTATFECKLDSGGFGACAALPALGLGPHTFSVRATNSFGTVDPTPASFAWTIADTTAPDTFIDTMPPNPSSSSGAAFTFHGTDDFGAVTLACKLDGGAFGPCAALPALGIGPHTFSVRATDGSGNTDATPATYSWTIADTTAPDTFIDTHPDNQTTSTSATFTFHGSDDFGAVTMACTLDAVVVPCAGPLSVALGTHTFTVAATDGSGNVDPSPATFTWTVVSVLDTTPPESFIDTHPADPTTSTDAAFTIHGTDNIGVTSFVCTLDGVVVACTDAISGLAVGEHTFTAAATDSAGNVDPTPASYTWTVQSSDSVDPPGSGDIVDYLPLDPKRLADTRVTGQTVDGQFAGGGVRAIGSTLELTVAGRGAVPSDAIAVALNVTAVDPTGPGYLTVFPCGQPQPTASNVNFTTGATVPNSVFAKIGAGGKVCIFTSQQTHLVVDVAGAFPAQSRFHPANPARVLDTRAGFSTVDGQQQGGGPAGLGSVTVLHLASRAGVPAGVDSVVLNLTASEGAAPGYVTVYPCNAPRPTSSNLNFVPGVDVANLVVAKTDPQGDVCLYTSQQTQLIADVNGYLPTGTSFGTVVPARLLDSRADGVTIDGIGAAGGKIALNTKTPVHVAGRAGVPAGATTVIVNATVTEPSGAGYATVYPCGIEPPLASNLNFATGQTVSNSAIVKVGAGGDICIYNSQSTHLVVDMLGYVVGD